MRPVFGVLRLITLALQLSSLPSDVGEQAEATPPHKHTDSSQSITAVLQNTALSLASHLHSPPPSSAPSRFWSTNGKASIQINGSFKNLRLSSLSHRRVSTPASPRLRSPSAVPPILTGTGAAHDYVAVCFMFVCKCNPLRLLQPVLRRINPARVVAHAPDFSECVCSSGTP
jgi:hypothetical protein